MLFHAIIGYFHLSYSVSPNAIITQNKKVHQIEKQNLIYTFHDKYKGLMK